MGKCYKWSKVFSLAVILMASVQAQAAHSSTRDDSAKTGLKGLTFSGNIEAGYINSWVPNGSSGSMWGVDDLAFDMTADVTDSTKVVLNNHFAAFPGAANSTTSAQFNTAAYASNASLASNPGGIATFTMWNSDAYIDHKFGDSVHLAVGQFSLPWGMESMSSRYDMATYYYSGAYGVGHQLGFLTDTGLKVSLNDVIPGNLEIAVIDGREGYIGGSLFTPGVSARYSFKMENGDMSLTPVVSAILNRFDGGPADVGLTAGLGLKMSSFFANAEWVFTGSRGTTPNGGASTAIWSLYAEPGVDLGMIAASAKIEFNSNTPGGGTAATNWNIGAGISHTYAEKYRIRLVYEHLNLTTTNGTPTNDIRLLFGTKF